MNNIEEQQNNPIDPPGLTNINVRQSRPSKTNKSGTNSIMLNRTPAKQYTPLKQNQHDYYQCINMQLWKKILLNKNQY